MTGHFFISYSKQDYDDVALQLKVDLEKRGLPLWMDQDIRAGTRWDDTIRDAIKQSLVVLYLVSPDSRVSPNVASQLDMEDVMPPESGEVATAIQNKFQFPVSLNPIQEQREMVQSYAPRNPYKGLRAFEYKDAQDFFGRHDLINTMIRQIRGIIAEEKNRRQSSRCMLVVSASGAGKSSTVLAGLLPNLQKDAETAQLENKHIPDIQRWLFLDPVRPGNEPMTGLIQALNRPFLNGQDVGLSPLERLGPDTLQQALDVSSLGLYNLLQRITTNPHECIVLTIDQFEELFAPTVDKGQQEQFIELLFATATQPRNNILIIATLRADFYDQVLKNPQLFAIMEAHHVEVPPLKFTMLQESKTTGRNRQKCSRL